MDEISLEKYRKFIENNKEVIIEDQHISIGKKIDIKQYEPENFSLEIENVWSFPKRGDWCTHYINAKYRGNYAPQIPRNIIMRYSSENDTVLDPFLGSGTTLIETKLLGRRGIGIDVNSGSCMIAMDRLNFDLPDRVVPAQQIYNGDARNLDKIEDNSIDLVITHPPYSNIISYSKNNVIDDDLSSLQSIDDFYLEMGKVAHEIFRVLKTGKYCAVLMGDSRKYKHHIPLSFRIMDLFLEQGFILKEDIIKIQHNTKTWQYWQKLSVQNNFLLLTYEHLFVFRKPEDHTNSKYKYSSNKNY